MRLRCWLRITEYGARLFLEVALHVTVLPRYGYTGCT